MVTGIRVWGNGLEWILLTTCPVAEIEDALRITGWYAVRRTVEEFHKAWKTGCRAAPRRLASADRLIPRGDLWPSSPSGCSRCLMRPGVTAILQARRRHRPSRSSRSN